MQMYNMCMCMYVHVHVHVHVHVNSARLVQWYYVQSPRFKCSEERDFNF